MKKITVQGFAVVRHDGAIAIHDHAFRAFGLDDTELQPLADALTQHDVPAKVVPATLTFNLPPEYDN